MLKIDMKDFRYRLLMAECRRWIGTKEKGNNKGEIVTLFQNWDDIPGHYAWCMAFVQFCVKAVDTVTEIVAGSDVKTKLYPSEHVLTVWNKTPKELRSDVPKPGYITVWQFFKDGKQTASGHTGIVVSVDGDKFLSVEGNTGPSEKTIQREGDGVYLKKRTVRGLQNMRVKGWLKPW